MYFSENLETCTIGWASFCEGGVGIGKESAFFILVGGDGTHRPHPVLWPHSPQVAPAHPDRLHSTGSSADRARCKPDRPQQATHRHTRPNAGHAGRSGRRRRWMAGNSSIMRIVIALSQAWSSDSNMHNYHINLLVYLVIVICYQALDLPP